MKAKLTQLREAWAAGDQIGALRIASRFSDRSPETKAFQRGWDAHSNPDFYRQLRRDPEAIVADALAAMARKFRLNSSDHRQPTETDMTKKTTRLPGPPARARKGRGRKNTDVRTEAPTTDAEAIMAGLEADAVDVLSKIAASAGHETSETNMPYAGSAETITSDTAADWQHGREAFAEPAPVDATAEPTPEPAPAEAAPKPKRAKKAPAKKKAAAKAPVATAKNATPEQVAEARDVFTGSQRVTPKQLAALEAAKTGTLPEPPDFSAPSYTPPYTKPRQALIDLATAGDVDGLRAFALKTYDSGFVALDRYRKLCIVALTAQAAA